MSDSTPSLPAPPVVPTQTDRRNAVTIKLIVIAGLILVLQLPLYLVSNLRQERMGWRGIPITATSRTGDVSRATVPTTADLPGGGAAEGYRMVERSLKHGVLVLSLVFTAFFLFEVLAGLRLHPIHYALVGAALCLFYLTLLALGEFVEPGSAYAGAAVSSSLLITLYSVAILRSGARALLIAALLSAVHGVLFIVLRMENYALLAGTAALFVALAAVMYFTRNVDWHGRAPATA